MKIISWRIIKRYTHSVKNVVTGIVTFQIIAVDWQYNWKSSCYKMVELRCIEDMGDI
jgi:hypothetical protein